MNPRLTDVCRGTTFFAGETARILENFGELNAGSDCAAKPAENADCAAVGRERP
jgi:hypothetical protein